ncbi:MAG: ORF6N domain-containing protein [Bacteroidia bacterium]|nr:ORF6N domain-containing protein [Bacteroidia bacterium]
MSTDILKAEYEILIFTIRGRKVMIDYDLAALYEVSTKALKQQVKRNRTRFPEDFMFILNPAEKEELVTNCDRLKSLQHSSVNPMAFTEQGVAMLSTVLRSEKAISINIEIMRAFARYRAILRENEELRKDVKKLDEKLNEAIKFLIERIDELHQGKDEPLKPIGFKYKKS